LAKNYDAQARSVLEPLLLSSDSARRDAAVQAFAFLSGAKVWDTLKNFVQKGTDGDATAAAKVLAKQGVDGSAALLSLVKQTRLAQPRRLLAAKALLGMDNGKHIPEVQALLASASASLRGDLLGALAELKTADAAKAVASAVSLGEQKEHLLAVKTLLDMGDTGKTALNALSGKELKPLAQDVTALIAAGMDGSETLLGNVLNAWGTLDMANAFLNSGNKTLYAAAEAWGKKNGYKVVTNEGNTTALTQTGEPGVVPWGSDAVKP
jgi:hypothetical protein